MKRLECQLELLTPAFLGSHEPRKLDEITPVRPHSVRGLLRWWFRTAAATLLWPLDDTPQGRERVISELRRVESAIFGSTKQSSTLVVLPPEVERLRSGPYEVPDAKRSPGLRYLGYGLFEGKAPCAIYPGTFSLTLGLRRDAPGVPELLGATLWLWTTLGGLGARSRRGYGSLRLVRAATDLKIPPERLSLRTTHSELLDHFRSGIEWATGVFRKHLISLPTLPLQRGRGPHVELRTLHGLQGPDALTVLPILFETGTQAMECMGSLFRDFRSTIRCRALGREPHADYSAVKESITSRRPPTSLARAAFGLPLPFLFRSMNRATATFTPVDAGRLASPLLLRVHRLTAGYASTLINLVARESEYVHPLLGKALTMRGGRPAPFRAPSGTILRDFTQWAKAQAQKIEDQRQRGQR